MSNRQYRSAAAGLKKAMERGRSADEALEESQRFAQDGVRKFGPAFLEQLGEDFTLDGNGVVRVKGIGAWSNGSMELRWMSEAAADDGWDAATLAGFMQFWRDEAGHEPAAAVQAIVRRIESDDIRDSQAIAGLLLAEAERIELERGAS
ncbi:hypothetical protein [Singulisphaera acidiphila]|uniref:Uncharacterized protein n=1 Tax=Singulisphaera acidiphila (strain ATCC BAA-1392 / DSM 18658 / VKM B-2454 / MOB10) TaxID=886293 RepID=L0DRM1_SINAD|nr:hypothetical protein [Singulisphaera acidiphila]AGA31645.1 hypothetical protein Sinac_7614 [Singulisphaera acidiphila DSM 18658]